MSETAKVLIHTALGFLVFPVTIIAIVPGVLISKFGYTLPHVGDVGFWVSKPLLPAGFVLVVWSVVLLVIYGRGAPAPWFPPKCLVRVGPYRYVRNPLVVGMLMMVVGEALIISSLPIAIWAGAVFLGFHAWIVAVEEPALLKRFGYGYQEYRRQTGRWFPKLTRG